MKEGRIEVIGRQDISS